MGVFAWGGMFYWTFRSLVWFVPRLKQVVSQYESGSVWAPLFMGAIGALILESALFLITKPLDWISANLGLLIAIYVAGSLGGWLSLMRMRDYKNEKD